MKALRIIPVLALTVRPALAQDVDAMARWTSLTVVHYRVVGEFSGETRILGPGERSFQRTANITDRVEIELDWNQQEFNLGGTPVIRNFPTKVVSVVPVEGCPAPRINGTLELSTLLAVKTDEGMRYSGIVILESKRDQPGGAIPHGAETAACGGAWDPAAPRSETSTVNLQLPPAMMLAMPGALDLTPDKKSLIVKSEGWTWTFTPTPGK